jgi:hypothetical protein
MSRPARLVVLSLALALLTTLASASTSFAAAGSAVEIAVDAGGASFTVPSSSTKGSVVANAARGSIVETCEFQGGCSKVPTEGWATFPSDRRVMLVHVPEMSGEGPYDGTIVASVPAGAGFRPESVRVGIIAILIGLVVQRVPVVGFQDGGDIVLHVFDGSSMHLLARQPIPAGQTASGFWDLLISS